MDAEFVKKMIYLADRLEKFELVLIQKCEICGPILRGADPSRYPLCKRHRRDM